MASTGRLCSLGLHRWSGSCSLKYPDVARLSLDCLRCHKHEEWLEQVPDVAAANGFEWPLTAERIWDDIVYGEHLFGRHQQKGPPMATITDVQTAFDAYVAAVNARIAELSVPVEQVDLDPLAAQIAAAQEALTPPAE